MTMWQSGRRGDGAAAVRDQSAGGGRGRQVAGAARTVGLWEYVPLKLMPRQYATFIDPVPIKAEKGAEKQEQEASGIGCSQGRNRRIVLAETFK